MNKRDSERKRLTRREFLGKALFPALGFGFLSIYFGKLLPNRREERGRRPNISFKEANHYSRLAG